MNKEINGISVNYDIKGSGDYVFILQGWGTSLEVYASVANLLAQNTLLFPLIFRASVKLRSRTMFGMCRHMPISQRHL